MESNTAVTTRSGGYRFRRYVRQVREGQASDYFLTLFPGHCPLGVLLMQCRGELDLVPISQSDDFKIDSRGCSLLHSDRLWHRPSAIGMLLRLLRGGSRLGLSRRITVSMKRLPSPSQTNAFHCIGISIDMEGKVILVADGHHVCSDRKSSGLYPTACRRDCPEFTIALRTGAVPGRASPGPG